MLTNMTQSGDNRRTVSVNVKMTKSDAKDFEAAAKRLWPGAILTRSSIVLSFARIGLEHGGRRSKPGK